MDNSSFLVGCEVLTSSLACAMPNDRVAVDGLVKLRWGRYSLAYRKRLLEGNRSLEGFLTKHDIQLAVVHTGSSKQVDGLLERFVQEMHTKGKKSNLRKAKHAVLFIQICRPRLRNRLQQTWTALKAWEEQTSSQLRSPLPAALLVAILCQARRSGWNSPSEKNQVEWYAFAALIGLGFFGLLRPGELLALQVEDIGLPNSLSLGSDCVVARIAAPKNSRQMGIHQFTTVSQPDVVNWIAWLVSVKRRQSDRLWHSSPQKFRVLFKTVCEKLGLSACRFSPASLRAGGATFLVDQGVEISKIRFLGRWSHLRSLEHYVQVARAQQLALELSLETSLKIRKLISSHWFTLALPAFLKAQVKTESLLSGTPLPTISLANVVRAVRTWCRSSEAIQEGDHQSRAFEGRKVS